MSVLDKMPNRPIDPLMIFLGYIPLMIVGYSITTAFFRLFDNRFRDRTFFASFFIFPFREDCHIATPSRWATWTADADPSYNRIE